MADTQEKPTALYATQVKAYPQRIKGTFRNIKWLTLSVVLGLYYVLPWLRWDRGPSLPNQAVLMDLSGPRIYFFAIEIWPQEIYYLTGLLVLGAIGLFLATAIAGRVWCGFTCPQTIWTDLFIYVEGLIEGDRNKRIKLDKGPWTLNKISRKSLKHFVWFVISILTGGVFIFYFADAPEILIDMLTGQASTTVYGFVALTTGMTYLLAGMAREQVCIYMCPWPRFQGSMFDEDSLIVTYEEWRGEPRGKPKKDAEGLGDCVDCNLCVAVCPVGIDIRKGQQFECIGCALCVDACDSIMTKLNRPLGLITYDSITNQNARKNGKPQTTKIVRPRTMAYAAMLLLVSGIMGYGLMNRSELEINVQRDRAPLFIRLSNGDIRNGYTFKILNMVNEKQTYTMTIDGLEDAKLWIIGVAPDPVEQVTIHVGADQVGTFRIFVSVSADELEEHFSDIEFVMINTKTGEKTETKVAFAGPED